MPSKKNLKIKLKSKSKSKKNSSKSTRKQRSKQRSKTNKKCNCGLPFLKWGGETGDTSGTDLTGKINNLFSNVKELASKTGSKINNDYDEAKNQTLNAVNSASDSAKSVINDTGNELKNATNSVIDTTKKNATDVSGKASSLFTNFLDKAKDSIHEATKPKQIESVTTKPLAPAFVSSTTKTTSTSSNTKSNSSNSNKYMNSAIKKYRNLLYASSPKEGGRRKLSKKRYTGLKRKNKRNSKRRKYNGRGGSIGITSSIKGVEYSTLAENAQPISNIKTVEPGTNQIYGQTPYPVWQYNK